MLTGDNGVDIIEVVAEVLLTDKLDVVKRLEQQGKVVAMVGDLADLGLAMNTGTDVAIETSDITPDRGDVRLAPAAIRLCRRTLGTIRAPVLGVRLQRGEV